MTDGQFWAAVAVTVLVICAVVAIGEEEFLKWRALLRENRWAAETDQAIKVANSAQDCGGCSGYGKVVIPAGEDINGEGVFPPARIVICMVCAGSGLKGGPYDRTPLPEWA